MENKQTEIEQARAILKQHGYFVDNLWHIEDVKGTYRATDAEAYSILEKSLTNPSTIEGVFDSIEIFAEYQGLTKLDN